MCDTNISAEIGEKIRRKPPPQQQEIIIVCHVQYIRATCTDPPAFPSRHHSVYVSSQQNFCGPLDTKAQVCLLIECEHNYCTQVLLVNIRIVVSLRRVGYAHATPRAQRSFGSSGTGET